MLGASVSFGVQLALIKFGAFWAVSLVLSIVALAWAYLAWRGRPAHEWLTRVLPLPLLLIWMLLRVGSILIGLSRRER